MANQRPIRRGRIPFRGRRRRRPSRWIDGNSLNSVECQFSLVSVSCLPSLPVRQLINGDLDLEWMDTNEVLLDRVVGSISVQGLAELVGPDMWAVPTLRMGLIVSEDYDVNVAAAAPTIDLWDAESLEEYEWMWLHQVSEWNMITKPGDPSPDPPAFRWLNDVPLDVRVRRKLGKRDALNLYAQWAVPVATFDVAVEVVPQLRTILMSK